MTVTKDLKKSIEDFPKMLKARPIIIDENRMILGGHKRYQVLLELGYEAVPPEWVRSADDFTEDEKKRFLLVDNVSFGEFDYEALEENFDYEELMAFGVEDFKFKDDELDLSLLDELEDGEAEKMTKGVRKAIQIEFDIDDYEEAKELVKYWREQKVYIGQMLIDKLKTERKDAKN